MSQVDGLLACVAVAMPASQGDIHPYFSYYDKRTGLSTEFDSTLSKLFAAKAQISIAERKEKEYIEYQRANNLFFDETTDGQLLRF